MVIPVRAQDGAASALVLVAGDFARFPRGGTAGGQREVPHRAVQRGAVPMKLARKLVFHIGCGYLDAISLVVR